MAQQDLYFVDVFVPNEGEPESALEIGILKWSVHDERPSVYVHSFLKPAAPNRIRWIKARQEHLDKKIINAEIRPTLQDILNVDFLKDKKVVCLTPGIEPIQSLTKNSSSVHGIINMWQEVYEDNEELSRLEDPFEMLKHLGFPGEDTSNTKYTKLLVRLHAMVALWQLLDQIKRDKLSKRVDGMLPICTMWPIKDRDESANVNISSLSSMSNVTIAKIFSQDLPDYLDWTKITIFSRDWVLNRSIPRIQHLPGLIEMADFIFNRVFTDVLKFWVLVYYALYEKKLVYAREIAQCKNTEFKELPETLRRDFSTFLILHLDDFLNHEQKYNILRAMSYHSMADRAKESFEHFDFDMLVSENKKQNSLEVNPYIFKKISAANDSNVICYKEIKTTKGVLFRRYEVVGDEKDREDCLLKVRDLFQEFLREIRVPLSDMWVSYDLQMWIQFLTGYSFDELKKTPRSNDSEALNTVRSSLIAIITENGTPYARELRDNLGNIFKELKTVFMGNEISKEWKLVFQGISIEVIYKKEKVSLLKRIFSF